MADGYSNMSLEELDKAISDLQQQIKDIDTIIGRGYDTMNVGDRTIKVEIPLFSDKYKTLMSTKKSLESQVKVATGSARSAALSYKPIKGPSNKQSRAYEKLVTKYGGVPFPSETTQTNVPANASVTGVILPDSKKTVVTGDLNKDGVVDAKDTALAPKDINKDGVIDSKDVAPTVISETPVVTTTTTKPTPTKVVPSAWVADQLELRGLPDTPANRKTLQEEYKKSKVPTLGVDWEQQFVAKYPELGAFLTDPIFGEDVKEIIKTAVQNQWFLYPETATAKIKTLIANTEYGRASSAKQEAFDKKSQADKNFDISDQVTTLKKTYGSLGLSDADWEEIGRTAARNGESSELTQQKMFQFVYKQSGTSDYEAVLKQVNASKLAQDVRKQYANYLISPDEDAVKAYATGEKTIEDIRREAMVQAKHFYPGLADLIDQGVSVKTVADQYASFAGDILEMPSSSINMMDPKFRVAFDARDPKNPRTMSIGEWQTMLKTDPNYGWQYTKTANQQALDIGTTIARAFGKVE